MASILILAMVSDRQGSNNRLQSEGMTLHYQFANHIIETEARICTTHIQLFY